MRLLILSTSQNICFATMCLLPLYQLLSATFTVYFNYLYGSTPWTGHMSVAGRFGFSEGEGHLWHWLLLWIQTLTQSFHWCSHTLFLLLVIFAKCRRGERKLWYQFRPAAIPSCFFSSFFSVLFPKEQNHPEILLTNTVSRHAMQDR